MAEDGGIYLTMATYPKRREIASQAIESILKQDAAFDHLWVYLNDYHEVPTEWPSDDRVTYHLGEHNLTDRGKFFWTGQLNGFHFTVDDDLIYPPDYVSTLLSAIELHDRRAIIGVHGRVYGNPVGDFDKYRHTSRAIVFHKPLSEEIQVNAVGTGTACYHTEHLTIDSAEMRHDMMVDIYVGAAAQKQGIPAIIIPRTSNWIVNNPNSAVDERIWNHTLEDIAFQHRLLEEIDALGPWEMPSNRTNAVSLWDEKSRELRREP
jgi:hypothetical protein